MFCGDLGLLCLGPSSARTQSRSCESSAAQGSATLFSLLLVRLIELVRKGLSQNKARCMLSNERAKPRPCWGRTSWQCSWHLPVTGCSPAVRVHCFRAVQGALLGEPMDLFSEPMRRQDGGLCVMGCARSQARSLVGSDPELLDFLANERSQRATIADCCCKSSKGSR